jgi:hypothetical protein
MRSVVHHRVSGVLGWPRRTPEGARRRVPRAGVSLLAASLAMVVACERGDGQRAGPTLDLRSDSMGVVPEARKIRVRGRRDLVENSGAAMSVRQPGVWFTINDSGNDPVLYALDTSGRDRGAWNIEGADNRDWEALTLGPCVGADVPSDTAAHCVYIGEIGDNGARYSSVIIHRVPEPRAGRRGFTGALSAVSLTFVYDGGPRDVEAMYTGPDGTLFFITKRALSDSAGRFRPSLVFTISPHAWQHTDSVVTAVLIDSLPIVPGSALGRQITGAERARDGSAVGIRTYTQLYVFRADPTTGRIVTTVRPTICSIAGLEERQGEGLAWFGANGEWLLTSEGRDEPLWVVGCPPPN